MTIAEILTDLEQAHAKLAAQTEVSGEWVQGDGTGDTLYEGDYALLCQSEAYGDHFIMLARFNYNLGVHKEAVAFCVLAKNHLPSVLAELKRATESEDHLLFILRQIVISLPTRLDWLDPNVERMAKEALEPAVGSCIHCSYLLGKVYKACDEHQVKEQS